MELSNYEQEEQLADVEKDRDFRIPVDTEVAVVFVVNTELQLLSLRVEASHNIPIRGVLIFAEGLFEGESYIWYWTFYLFNFNLFISIAGFLQMNINLEV